MTAYIRQLEEELSREVDESLRRAQIVTDEMRDQLSPLKDRLARLLATIPDDVQREGLALPVLQAALRGRHRRTCHPGELGTALRSLGFTRQRSWNNGQGFSARWFRLQTASPTA